jgi:hypothetical protein
VRRHPEHLNHEKNKRFGIAPGGAHLQIGCHVNELPLRAPSVRAPA